MKAIETPPTPRRSPGRPPAFDREAALEKAMLLFWRHGFEATSIAQLTGAMGINPPSLYAAFGGKKQLFVEAARRYAGEPDGLKAMLSAAPTARAGIESLILAAAERFTGPATPPGCLLASAVAGVSDDASELQAMAAAMRRDVREMLAERIQRDLQQGVLPPSSDAALLATTVLGIIQAMAVLARDGMDRQALLAMADQMMAGWPQ